MGYTLVTFHAHPDDEAIATRRHDGARQGRRAPRRARRRDARRARRDRAPTCSRRRRGARRAARRRDAGRRREVLGVDRVEFLGYRDSGMAGEPTNDAAGSVRRAPTSTKPRRASPRSCDEEHADVLTVYDDNGGYGHPDHIQVHRVGVARGRARGNGRVYEATMNRDYIQAPHGAATGSVADDVPDEDARPPRTWTHFGVARGGDHDDGRRRATSSTASAMRWPRTRARSRPTRSSSQMPARRVPRGVRLRVVHPPRRRRARHRPRPGCSTTDR